MTAGARGPFLGPVAAGPRRPALPGERPAPRPEPPAAAPRRRPGGRRRGQRRRLRARPATAGVRRADRLLRAARRAVRPAQHRRAARDGAWDVLSGVRIGDRQGEIVVHVAGNAGASSSVLTMLDAHLAAAPGAAYVSRRDGSAAPPRRDPAEPGRAGRPEVLPQDGRAGVRARRPRRRAGLLPGGSSSGSRPRCPSCRCTRARCSGARPSTGWRQRASGSPH